MLVMLSYDRGGRKLVSNVLLLFILTRHETKNNLSPALDIPTGQIVQVSILLGLHIDRGNYF